MQTKKFPYGQRRAIETQYLGEAVLRSGDIVLCHVYGTVVHVFWSNRYQREVLIISTMFEGKAVYLKYKNLSEIFVFEGDSLIPGEAIGVMV